MAITLTVGLSRKIGQPSYGSISATCNVTFEADSGLLDSDHEAFRSKVRTIFAECSAAVDDELAQQDRGTGSGYVPPVAAPAPVPPPPAEPRPTQAHAEVNQTFKRPEPSSGERRPQNGRALYAWASKHDETDAPGLKKYLSDFAKRNDWGFRFDDWNGDQVNEAFEVACEFLAGTVKSEPAPRRGGGWGGSNGASERGDDRRSNRRGT